VCRILSDVRVRRPIGQMQYHVLTNLTILGDRLVNDHDDCCCMLLCRRWRYSPAQIHEVYTNKTDRYLDAMSQSLRGIRSADENQVSPAPLCMNYPKRSCELKSQIQCLRGCSYALRTHNAHRFNVSPPFLSLLSAFGHTCAAHAFVRSYVGTVTIT
jgi:hypothetical protein